MNARGPRPVGQNGAMSAPAATPLGPLPLGQATTVDRVAQELRRAVFDGELGSGTPLREVALAASLGVSRPTVREALTLLVAEGLATREPHRGVSIATPEAASVRDICAARWVLEGAGVRAWAQASAAQRRRVRTTLEAYTSAVHAGVGYQELNERHLAFHVSLIALTGSPRLVHMAEQLMTELRLALAQVARLRRNAHDEADHHTRLVLLLEAGDVDAAHELLRRHLADAAADIISALELEPGSSAPRTGS